MLNLRFFREPIKTKNRFVPNVEQRRLKKSSPSLVSHLEEDLSLLPPKGQVVPPVMCETVAVADKNIIRCGILKIQKKAMVSKIY